MITHEAHPFYNVQRAIKKLQTFLQRDGQDEVVQAAVVQAFEYTFEAFWKALQKVAASEGLPVASPKRALAFGFQRGLCIDEEVWLAMLRDRNLTTHTYDESLARAIYTSIRDSYAPALLSALERAAEDP